VQRPLRLPLAYPGDDEEFYRLRASLIHSELDLLDEAACYTYYYDSVREHSPVGY
jgi:hypothetical protein